MNCQHRMDDMVAPSNSDVTRKAIWEPDENGIVAGKRLVTREQYSSFAPQSFKAAFNTCNRFINCILLCLATITNVLKGLTKYCAVREKMPSWQLGYSRSEQEFSRLQLQLFYLCFT